MKSKIRITICLLLFPLAACFAQQFTDYSDSISILKNGRAKYYTPLGSSAFFSKKQIRKQQLLVQVGITCRSLADNSFDPYDVQSYCIALISNGEVFYRGEQNDAYFSKELKEEFKKLTKGDLIVVYNIKIINSKREEKAPSFVYDVL